MPIYRATILCFLIVASTAYAQQKLTAAEAAKHEGERATVCGSAASVHTAMLSRGEPTFINLDKPYPNEVFSAPVWGDDRSQVGALPKNGDHVCVTGKISDYKGTPEIVVRDAKSLAIKP